MNSHQCKSNRGIRVIRVDWFNFSCKSLTWCWCWIRRWASATATAALISVVSTLIFVAKKSATVPVSSEECKGFWFRFWFRFWFGDWLWESHNAQLSRIKEKTKSIIYRQNINHETKILEIFLYLQRRERQQGTMFVSFWISSIRLYCIDRMMIDCDLMLFQSVPPAFIQKKSSIAKVPTSSTRQCFVSKQASINRSISKNM